MSDHAMYHALASQDRQYLGTPSQPTPPPASQSPYQAPLPGSQPAGFSSDQYSNSNAGYVDPSQGQSFIQPHGPYPEQYTGDGGAGGVAGLTAQIGALGVGDGVPAGTGRGTKKKSRHAFHALDAPPSSALPYNGAPDPAGSQHFNVAPHQPAGAPLLAGPQPSPGLFPAPANEPFNPARRASPMELASRGGTPNTFNAPAASFGGAQATSPQGRVDPEQVPSVPRSRDGPAQYYLDHIYPTLENHLPPPAAVPFLAYDQGNSSPKFARLTMNNIPSTAESLASTGLPLGLLLQPLAALQPGEMPIPVLDFGESGPPRCRRCRAYINPFMSFRAGGNKFVCNMCTFPNEVPAEYFSPVNPQGLRVDRDQRPELTRGTVEFMVPKEYWAQDPVPLRLLFLIDVSQESFNKGFLEGFCEGIRGALYGKDDLAAVEQVHDEVSEGEGTARRLPVGSKVAIVTYDKEVHFYNLLVSQEFLRLSNRYSY